MSRNAKHLSSSKIIFAGICFDTNLSKNVDADGFIAGSDEAAKAAFSNSLLILTDVEENWFLTIPTGKVDDVGMCLVEKNSKLLLIKNEIRIKFDSLQLIADYQITLFTRTMKRKVISQFGLFT
jgi:hypothetical protein